MTKTNAVVLSVVCSDRCGNCPQHDFTCTGLARGIPVAKTYSQRPDVVRLELREELGFGDALRDVANPHLRALRRHDAPAMRRRHRRCAGGALPRTVAEKKGRPRTPKERPLGRVRPA